MWCMGATPNALGLHPYPPTFDLQAAVAGGSGAQRELSSARLHLRGLIKQSQERYEDHEAFQQLQQLLQSVEEEQQKQ